MNKAELIQALSAYYGSSKSEAAKALNAVVETITYKTAAGEKVSITGFGVFEKVHRSARMRNRVPVSASRPRRSCSAFPRRGPRKPTSQAPRRCRGRPPRRRRIAGGGIEGCRAARKRLRKAPAKKTGTTARKTAAKR